MCVNSWKYYNPDWNILLIDDTNLINYVNLEDYIPGIYNKNIQLCHLSDIIRGILLKSNGGLWVDATTFCNKSLNDWLPDYINEGFFAFDRPSHDRLISNFFLYSDKDNYIIDKWSNHTLEYYTINDKADTYYIHHYLFGELYNSDTIFKEMWDKVPKYSAIGYGPLYLLERGINKGMSNQHKLDIDNKITPFYKLTSRINPEYHKPVLHYLYSTINFFCRKIDYVK